LDPATLDRVICTHLREAADYVWVERMPKGIAQETLSRHALERAWQNATLPSDAEHVITYVASRPDEFRVLLLAPPEGLDLPQWSLTLDSARDYELLSWLFQLTRGYVSDMAIDEIVQLIRHHPPLLSMVQRETLSGCQEA
jgi:spore coat polysaccharide biosynthesis protein SpsF